MGMRRSFGFVVAFSAATALTAYAQGIVGVLLPVGQYTEVFLDHPKVSGNVLVGLRWATSNGGFNPDDVRVQTAAVRGAPKVCVDVVSKDGRYTAENVYDVASSTVPAPRLKSLTKYGDQLRGYSTDDIAVIIHPAASCDAAIVNTVVPAIVDEWTGGRNTPNRSELLAFVNADPERVGVSLLSAQDQTIASGSCQAAGSGVRIAYSTLCTIAVPADTAGARLRLSIRERFKTIPNDYKLLLP